MSSEYATEQVPLTEIQEGDTIQDPMSGQWFTVTRTADGTTSVTHKHADGDRTVIEGYRVYYGDEREGEQVDSRCIIDTPVYQGPRHSPGARVIATVHATRTNKVADLCEAPLSACAGCRQRGRHVPGINFSSYLMSVLWGYSIGLTARYPARPSSAPCTSGHSVAGGVRSPDPSSSPSATAAPHRPALGRRRQAASPLPGHRGPPDRHE